MSVIEIKNVTKKYKKFTLNNVSFNIEEGEICGFIGENGAGKSTTLKILAGISSFDEGEVKIKNQFVDKLSKLEREDISFILDELNFPENLKLKNIELILRNIFTNWEKDTYYSLLKEYGLDQDKKCKELSKGMKVKLNIAISLSHKAKVFILDEPTNGLDPVARDEILDKLIQIANNGGTILISSHLVEDLERISSRIIFIHQGNIIINEKKDTLINSYDLYDVKKEVFDTLDKNKVIKYKENIDGTISIITKKDSLTNDIEGKIAFDLTKFMILFIRGNNLWKVY